MTNRGSYRRCASEVRNKMEKGNNRSLNSTNKIGSNISVVCSRTGRVIVKKGSDHEAASSVWPTFMTGAHWYYLLTPFVSS
jgi:hypothetical protein